MEKNCQCDSCKNEEDTDYMIVSTFEFDVTRVDLPDKGKFIWIKDQNGEVYTLYHHLAYPI